MNLISLIPYLTYYVQSIVVLTCDTSHISMLSRHVAGRYHIVSSRSEQVGKQVGEQVGLAWLCSPGGSLC